MARFSKLNISSGTGDLRLSQLPAAPAIPKTAKSAPKAAKKKGSVKAKVTAKGVKVVEPTATNKKWGK